MKAIDGPAAGVDLLVHRAPRFLRVVQSPSGKWDALDQLEDTPARRERIYVYRLASKPIEAHLNFGSTRRGSGFYALGDYVQVADVDGESVRETAAWQAWCRAQAEAATDVDEAPR